VSGNLTFAFNPDKLVCEGQTVGANNQPVDPTDMAALVFDPTDILNVNGQPVGRVRCARFPDQDETNTATTPFTTAPDNYVNLPCHNGESGPKRDCGFGPQPASPPRLRRGVDREPSVPHARLEAGAAHLRAQRGTRGRRVLHVPGLRVQQHRRRGRRVGVLQLPGGT
jgi:hypothetical protein